MQKAWRKPGVGELSRALGVALLVALALAVLYVGGATLILRTHLLERWLNQNPDELEVKYESAWSFFPGTVRVRGLRVRVQDSNVQFLLHIDRATADIALFDLFQRRFHVTEVNAQGTRFRFRMRLPDVAGQERRVKAFPPIAGFADPPLKGWNVPHKKLAAKPFSIEIERVNTTFDELWFLEYRYAGPGRARGSFRLLPGQRVRVKPAELDLQRGTLTFGAKERVLERLSGSLRCKLDDFDVRAVKGWRVFNQLSATGTLSAALQDLGFVRAYLGDQSLAVSGGQGSIEANIVMKHGRFEPDSRASYRTARIQFSKAPFRLAGDAALALKVERQRAATLGTLAVSASKIQASLDSPSDRLAPAEVTDLSVHLSTRELGVSETWKMADAELRLPRIAVPDLRLFGVLARESKGLRIEGGSAAASARARLDRGSVRGQLAAELDDARLRVNGTRVTISAKASAELEQPSVTRGDGELSGIRVNATRVRVVTPDGDTGLGSVRLERGMIRYADLEPRRASATLSARFPDAKPVLAALGIHLSTLPRLAAGLIDTSDLRGIADLSHDRTRRTAITDVRLREARTDGLVTSGRWRKIGKATRAAFLLDFDVARLGVSVKNSESSLSPFVAKDWLGEELARLGMRAGGTERAD